MLEAYRALDLTDEKGQFCARILGDLGADVVRIEPPGGSPARKYGPFLGGKLDPEKSLSWFAYNTNKRGVTLNIQNPAGQEALKRLVDKSHFLIESYPPGYLERLGLGYDKLSDLNPGLIMVSITPFGQDGPRCHWKTSDLVSMATGGIMYIAGDADNPPVRVSIPHAYGHAGTQAAAGAMIAHYHRLKTGEGQHVDVSIQEAVMWVNSEVPQYWDMLGVNRIRSGGEQLSRRGTARTRQIFRCKDGYVAFSVGLGPRGGPNIAPLIGWMDAEGKADGLGEIKGWTPQDWLLVTPEALNQERTDLLEQEIERFFLEHTKLELHEFASLHDMRIYMVSNPKDLVENPQLKAREFFRVLAHPELQREILYPGAWAKSSIGGPSVRRRAPLIGEHNQEILGGELGLSEADIEAVTAPNGNPFGIEKVDGPRTSPKQRREKRPRRGALHGIRVIEFAWVASGPTIGKHLAEHGAEVIRVESTSRVDNLRNLRPWKSNKFGVNRSGFFARYNSNKFGITLDTATPRGLDLARRLVETADIVTESFSAGTMIRMGLGYRALRAINPQIIMLSTNMWGQTGPWAEQGGAGAVGAAVAGVSHFVGWPDGPPLYVGTPYTDYVSPGFGVALLMAALDYRERTGEGQYIDLSQIECAVHLSAPAILDYVANGNIATRRGNRSRSSAPHNAYRCRGDDRWCAIAVRDEAQWKAFCQVLGGPEWTRDKRFSTMAGRLAHQDVLDRFVEGWSATLDAADVAERLQNAGVPAGAVMRGEDFFRDPQLAARGHFVHLNHPEIGRYAGERMSYRLSRTPGALERPAPCLGQHNEEIMRRVLKLTQQELEQAILEEAFGW